MNLWDLKDKSFGIITNYSSELPQEFLNRLIDFGIIKEARVLCFKTTPMKGTKLYQVNGQVVSLSRELAELISINLEPPMRQVNI